MKLTSEIQGKAATGTSRLGWASVILGALSICPFSFLTGIPAIICGGMVRARVSRDATLQGGRRATLGIVFGIVGAFIVPVTLVVLSVGGINLLQDLGRTHRVTMLVEDMENVAKRAGAAALRYRDQQGHGPATEEDLKPYGFSRSILETKMMNLTLLPFDGDTPVSAPILRLTDTLNSAVWFECTGEGGKTYSKELQAELAKERALRESSR